MAQLKAGNKWLLLGAMKEMGTESATEHQALVDQLVQVTCNRSSSPDRNLKIPATIITWVC